MSVQQPRRLKACLHRLLFIGAHPSFQKGWVCADCKRQIDLADLSKYVGCFALIRKVNRHAEKGGKK